MVILKLLKTSFKQVSVLAKIVKLKEVTAQEVRGQLLTKKKLVLQMKRE